jgi:hypothetical protein
MSKHRNDLGRAERIVREVFGDDNVERAEEP